MTRSVTDSLTPVQYDRILAVVDHVAQVYGLTREDVLNGTRHRCAEARSVVVYAAMFVLDHSFTQLATAMGRHRATLGLGYKSLQRRMRGEHELHDRVFAVAAFAKNLLHPPASEAKSA